MHLSQLQYFATLFSVLLISELCLVQLNAKLQLNSFINSLENEFVSDLVSSNDDSNLNDNDNENVEILSVNSYMNDEQNTEKCSSECKQIEQFRSKAFEFAPKVGLTIENIRSVFQKCSSKPASKVKCSKFDENSMKIITSCVVQNIYPMFKLDQNQKIKLIPILQKISNENQNVQVNSLNDNLKYNYDWNESNGENSDSDYATVDSTAVAPSPDEIKKQLIFAALRGTRRLLASSRSRGSGSSPVIIIDSNESPSQFWRMGHLPLAAAIPLWIVIIIVAVIALACCSAWFHSGCPGFGKCCDVICCPCEKLSECCEYGPDYACRGTCDVCRSVSTCVGGACAAAGNCTGRTCTRMNNAIGIPVIPPPQQSHPNYPSHQPVRHDVMPIYPPVSRNGKIDTSSSSSSNTENHMSDYEYYSRLEMAQFQNHHKREQSSLAHPSIMYPPQKPQMDRIADHLSHTKNDSSSTSNTKTKYGHETPSSPLFGKMSPRTEQLWLQKMAKGERVPQDILDYLNEKY